MFHKLRNDQLIDAYIKAITLDLDPYFILLIENELAKRGLSSIQKQISDKSIKP